METVLHRTLPRLAWALAGFYGALALYWALALRPALPTLAMLWLGSCAAMAGVALLTRWSSSPRVLVHASTGLALVVVVASGMLVRATGNPALMLAPCVAILGLSFFIISRLILALSLVAAFGFWASSALAWGGDWSAGGIALAASGLVAGLAQDMRLRLYRQVESSHRLQVESELRARDQERLRREAESTSRFLNVAAHQLATPLTTLTVQARILVDHLASEGQAHASAQMVQRNVDRLNAVLADILVLTQHQEHSLPLDQGEVDLGKLVRDAGVPWKGSAPPIAGDETRLRNALGKLLDNARGRSQSVVAVLGAHEGQVTLDIIDEGPLVPAGERASMFGPLGEELALANLHGFGVSVAAAIIEAHGGALAYDVHDGRNRIRVTLPMAGRAR